MKPGLSVGQSAELHWQVSPERTIALGGGRATVFSTPSMINLMEHAARAALEPFLDTSEETVGVDVMVKHLAATPLNAGVRGVATVTRVDNRLIDFDITAFDSSEQIGQGTHRRAVIDVDKLAKRLEQQKGGVAVSAAQVVPEPVIRPNAGEMPPLSVVQCTVANGVATVAMNRPAVLNVMDPAMGRELRQVVDWLAGHAESVRVVVLTGAGRAFCAGDDLKAIQTLPIEEAEAWNVRQCDLLMSLQRIPQPIIAAINGPCFGGGAVLACACDFRLASRNATFGMPEAKHGWVPSFGIPQLAAVVGKANALDLCLRGRTITAERALAIGLVNEIAPPAMLARSVDAFARELMALAPVSLRETRQLIQRIVPDATSFTETLTHAAYTRCLRTQDAREGLAAFFEKRPPKFQGK
jgi:enoyl-CoA hydratase/carnithine racemase/predicted thioesterase